MIQENFSATKIAENLCFLVVWVSAEHTWLVMIDDNFQPFDFYSLIQNAENIHFNQEFLPLNDPNLNKLIQEHQVDLQISEDGHHIFLPEIDQQNDQTSRNMVDPLAI